MIKMNISLVLTGTRWLEDLRSVQTLSVFILKVEPVELAVNMGIGWRERNMSRMTMVFDIRWQRSADY
jgi:hypothetical protein